MRGWALLVAGAVALLCAAACNDGGGGSGSALEQYFNELEGFSTEMDERRASLAETVQTSDDLDELRAAVSQYPGIVRDFIEELQTLEAPSEAADAQQATIDAGEELLDLLAGVVAEAEQAETEVEFIAALESDAVEHASDAFTLTCLALQALADQNAIDVDLGCGE